MDTYSFNNFSHRRFNLLTGEWILVSPRRARRPWSGQLEKTVVDKINNYSPDCYLCPGNKRANGAVNPRYTGTFVFDNDFAALLPNQAGSDTVQTDELLHVEPEQGICRVICYSPRHDLTLGRLPTKNILDVIDAWIDQTKDLSLHKNISSLSTKPILSINSTTTVDNPL
jgi:UDPglucose--hexose-1-phosphate uridylyltransferase